MFLFLLENSIAVRTMILKDGVKEKAKYMQFCKEFLDMFADVLYNECTKRDNTPNTSDTLDVDGTLDTHAVIDTSHISCAPDKMGTHAAKRTHRVCESKKKQS